MDRIEFSAQSRLVKFAVGLTLFNTWVLFEETIIDRHGLWKYLPFYKFDLRPATP